MSGPREAMRLVKLIFVFSPLWLALISGCGGRSSGQTAPPAACPRPNIVFILVDTLRADRLGCYGHAGGLSPMIDALAGEGVLFERTIATSPWTLPSVASYLSGLYPTVHKVTSYQQARQIARTAAGKVTYFADDFAVLPELLRDGGYATAGFSANPFVTRKFGFAQGFDDFDSSFANNDTPGNVVNAAALAWLERRDPAKPFFLYLHYMDVHDPYVADDKYLEPLLDAVEKWPGKRLLARAEASRHRRFFGKSLVAYAGSQRHRRLAAYAEYWQARYDAGVAQMNQYLDELRSGLEALGVWKDTYVILTADHGESLGEHRLWAHGLSAHQDQLHVPLILRWPGRLPAGKRVSQTVRLFDVMPTLLAQLRIEPPASIQARSLVELIAGQARESLPAFAEAVKRKPGEKALIVDEWKLLAHTDEARYELYNLRDDPMEHLDLAGRYPQRVATLRRVLDRQVEENRALGRDVEQKHAEITEDELRRFKAIGYFSDDYEEAVHDANNPSPDRDRNRESGKAP